MTDDGTLATLPPTTTIPAPGPPELGDRYALGSVIGRGGMGEVRIARDKRIDREVAVKLLRDERRDDDAVARFFREARVQGALEHPAVVPVHDLGIDRDGQPYFVMKRLAGTTLADVLASRDRERWPTRRLLARVVDVCLAIEFAHAHGVVHRDLKPANIMLGDFGEAYVLDWGIARILDDAAPIASVLAIGGEHGHTVAGDVLGTPGYLPPEQARGELVDPRSDVFSLGCVVFEILAGVPALPRGLAALAETLEAKCHRPSTRAADVPPELDELCARATAATPGDRPTARELADGIQAYLDGDRDIARRRELATHHAERARAALDQLGEPARATAMREAGRALALDSENQLAAQVLARLLLDSPDHIPAAARAAADAERCATRQYVLRWGAVVYLGIALVVALAFQLPIRHQWQFAVTLAMALGTAGAHYALSRKPLSMRSPWFVILLTINCAMLAMSGLLFGPLLVTPLFLIGSFAAWMAQSTAYRPWIVIVAHAIPITALFALEYLGVLPSTFRFESGALVLTAPTLDLTPGSTGLLLAFTALAQCSGTTFVALSGRRAHDAAQDRLHAHQWHLKQLLPDGDPPDLCAVGVSSITRSDS